MKQKLICAILASTFAPLAVLAWDNPLTVAANETYTLPDDETHDQLIVNEGSVIELNGHNLTIKGAFSPSSTDANRAIIRNDATGDAAKMTFTLTQGIGSKEFTKVQFAGNLALEVSAGFSAAEFMNGVNNTHTGGTTLKNITGNQNPRINTADGLGGGAVIFGENSNLRDINGSAYTYSWTSLTSKGDCTNYFYMERNHSIGAIPVVVEKGNTFALSDLRNGLGDWNRADYSGVVGTFWVNGNGNGNINFCPDIPHGVLMLSGKEIRNGTHVTDGYVWRIGAIASPASATANDTGALLRRVDGTGGKVTVEVGSANVDTTWYGQFVYDNHNNKDWNIKKVGTGTWTIGGVNYYHGTTEIADGAILLIAGGELGDSGTAPDINLTGGALLLGTGVGHEPTKRVKTPVAGVPAKLGSPDAYTINNTLSGITQGITKVGGGTLTLTSTAMDFTGAVKVEEGTLELPADAVLATAATVKENGKLKIGNQVFQYKAGHTGDVTVRYENGQYISEQELIEGCIQWKGADNADWNVGGNWEGGNVPGADDIALFDGDATVVFGTVNNPAVDKLYVNGRVTLSMSVYMDKDTGDRGLHVKGIEGSGTLVLDDARISTVSGNALTSTVPIEIAGTRENWITGLGAAWRQEGAITGSGTVNFRGWSANGRVNLAGDNSGFTGTGIIDADGSNGTCFVVPEAGSASATWKYDGKVKTNRILFDDRSNAGTIKFGCLRQTVWENCMFRVNLSNWSSVITLEIGNDDTENDSLIMGRFGDAPWTSDWQRPNANCKLKKVGASTLKLYDPCVRCGFLLNGGVVEVIGPDALKGYLLNGKEDVSPISFNGGTLKYGYDSTSETKGPVTTDWSEYVRNSTAAIKVETTGTDVTWATALGDSNETHEIVKTGAGDLIITAVPTWGTTKVTVGFDSKGAVLLPAEAPYELGVDGIHTTRVSAETINNVEYNKFTNPMGLTIILR